MDRRTILAIFLSITFYYVWVATMAPPPSEEVVEEQSVAPDDAALPAEDAPTWEAPERTVDYPIAECKTRASWSSATGAISDMTLLDHEARFEVQTIWGWALSGFSGPFQPYPTEIDPERLLTDKAQALVAGAGDRGVLGAPVRSDRDGAAILGEARYEDIEVTTRLAPNDKCGWDLDVTWTNKGTRPYARGLWLGIHDELPEENNRYAATMRPWASVEGDTDGNYDLDDLREETEYVHGPVDWIGLTDNYFAFLAGSKNGPVTGTAEFGKIKTNDGYLYGTYLVLEDHLPAGQAVSKSFEIYAGPKDHKDLVAANPSFSNAIELGFFATLARPMLWLLRWFEGISGNWGWAIVLLTVTIKGILFPLNQKAYKSSQAMQVVAPQMKELREKYKDNPQEQMRQQQILFREAGVNPLGGCLPMVAQMPVFFALYSVIGSSVELYHADFYYLKDLASADPFGVLPVLYMVLMFGMQQFTPTGGMDPAQARVMKALPFVFGFLFFTFPSGLVLYFVVNLALTVLQQWYIKKTFKAPVVKQG